MLLPPALRLLFRLRLKAGWRTLRQTLRSPKGAIFVGIGALMVFGWITAVVAGMAVGAKAPRPPTEKVALLAPFAILAFLLLSMLRNQGDAALAFLQAEVDLLFPAPFTRQQLLLYKLSQRVVPLFLVSFFFAIWLRPMASSWGAVFAGVYLALWFLHLAGLCLALIGQMLEADRFAKLRRGLALLVIAVIAIGAYTASDTAGPGSLLDRLVAFAKTDLGRLLALPTAAFAKTALAPSIASSAFLLWGGCAVAINFLLVGVAMRLDVNWLEAGAESSRRLAARIEAVQKTGSPYASMGGSAKLGVPSLPRLGGIGPLLWRQYVIGVRQGPRVLFVLAAMVAAMSLPRFLNGEGSWIAVMRPLGGFLLGYVSLFVPQILRLDFRGDIDRMDLLKSLPVPSFFVAAAQVLAPATLITLFQAPAFLLLDRLLEWHIPYAPMWLPAILFVNVMVAAIENATFLLWPARPSRGAGVQFASGQVVAQMMKMIVLILLIGGVAAIAAATAAATGGPTPAVALVATIGFAVEAVALVAIVARLFRRFDPAAEQVPDA